MDEEASNRIAALATRTVVQSVALSLKLGDLPGHPESPSGADFGVAVLFVQEAGIDNFIRVESGELAEFPQELKPCRTGSRIDARLLAQTLEPDFDRGVILNRLIQRTHRANRSQVEQLGAQAGSSLPRLVAPAG